MTTPASLTRDEAIARLRRLCVTLQRVEGRAVALRLRLGNDSFAVVPAYGKDAGARRVRDLATAIGVSHDDLAEMRSVARWWSCGSCPRGEIADPKGMTWTILREMKPRFREGGAAFREWVEGLSAPPAGGWTVPALTARLPAERQPSRPRHAPRGDPELPAYLREALGRVAAEVRESRRDLDVIEDALIRLAGPKNGGASLGLSTKPLVDRRKNGDIIAYGWYLESFGRQGSADRRAVEARIEASGGPKFGKTNYREPRLTGNRIRFG